MADHKLQVTLDEATGRLTVRHYATAALAGRAVVSHEDVELGPRLEAELRATLTGLLDANRAEMEAVAGTRAAEHVAAVARTQKGKAVALAAGAEPRGAAGVTT